MSDTADLLARVLQHDEAAARVLVEELTPLLARIVNAYPTLNEEGEDLMQDILLKVFRKLGSFRGDAPLEHWVSRLARFACIDRLRRKKARPELRESDLSPKQSALLRAAEQPAAGNDLQVDAASGLIERLFARLRPLDAWLLREVEMCQRSLSDVAAEAGWNIGLAHVRLFRARQRLQRAYTLLESHTP